jgi:hypothetical protein
VKYFFVSVHALVALSALSTLAAGAGPLPRSHVVISNATVDLTANTVRLPLHRGTAKGKTVWYIVTDASDQAAASKLGVLYAPLLAQAGPAVETVGGTIDALAFSGTVDFGPTRVFKADASGAPTAAVPGSVGDAAYSPLVQLKPGGTVYNAPIVAAGDAPHDVAGHTDTLDRVVAIETSDPAHATVMLALARGFTNEQPIAYISTDASEPGPAAIERSTFAPRLRKLAGGAIPIDVFFNGPHQGIPFAAFHGQLAADASPSNVATLGSPLNIQATFPAADNGASGYSPMWDVYALAWTQAALSDGKATVLRSQTAVNDAEKAGLVTTPDGKPVVRAGIFVNCPVVAFAEKRP